MGTYTDLDKIKRKLSSVRGDKVRFSTNSLVQISVKTDLDHRTVDNNDLLFIYEDLVFSSDFLETATVVLHFDRGNNTDYNIYLQMQHTDRRNILVGQGDTSSTSTVFSGGLEIPSTVWSGTIAEGDRVELKIDTHISDDLAEEYIEETEYIIDSMLVGGAIGHESSASLLFTALTVPNLVTIATTYMTAFYIYTDLFFDKESEREDKGYKSFASKWKDKAEKTLASYIKESKTYSTPSVLSFPSFITKFGIDYVPELGDCQQGITDDYDTLTENDDLSSRLFNKEEFEVD